MLVWFNLQSGTAHIQLLAGSLQPMQICEDELNVVAFCLKEGISQIFS